MRQQKVVRAGGIICVILLAACGRPRAVVVEMKQVTFVPAQVQLHKGDTLVFVNHDIFPHTATAQDHSWDSGTIEPDSSWRYVITSSADFLCTFHPVMQGTVAVR